jgi:hypothetical protein
VVSASYTEWWNLDGLITPANCLAAYQPIGAADYAASKINLANPGTYNATDSAAPDWDATNGWDFNGTTHRLLTGIVPAAGYTMIVRFSNYNQSVVNGIIIGFAASATQRFNIQPVKSTGHFYCYGDAAIDTGSFLSNGIMCMAGDDCYLNGSLEATLSGTWGATIYQIGIGASGAAAGANFADTYIQAVAIYDTAITSDQVSALTAAINLL